MIASIVFCFLKFEEAKEYKKSGRKKRKMGGTAFFVG